MMPAAPRRLRKQQQQLQKQREVRFAAEQAQMKAREVEAAQKQFNVLMKMKQAKEAKRQAEESAKMKIMRETAVVAEKRYKAELARWKQENNHELAALKAKLAKATQQQQQDLTNGSVFILAGNVLICHVFPSLHLQTCRVVSVTCRRHVFVHVADTATLHVS